MRHVPRGDENVVAYGVAHQNLPVAVVDHSARRVDGGVDHGVVGGVFLVFVVDDLDIEEPGQQYDGGCGQSQEEFVLAVYLHLASVSGQSRSAIGSEIAELRAREAANFTAMAQSGLVPALSAVM